MPSKTEEYLALAQQTAKELTRYWENWTDYLTTASRLYKYSFADQLMIYAQRPDATACADYDIWNNRMNRYVRRGSKGIALLDESSGFPRLHYVFDVSDTGVRRNSRDPEVWQLGSDLVQPVSEMIAREYGVYHERLSQQISDLTGKLVDSYWDNNSGDILDIVDGSFLIDYDEAGQEFQFKSAAAISILYTVLERCGLEPDGHFDRDDFQAIFSFSTPAAVYALGTAVSECSRDVLRNIERTVKTTIRRRNAERSQHEYEQQERDLLDHRGLPTPEPDPAPAGKSTGQIRQTAPDLPDAASPGAVQFDAPVGDSVSAPVGSGADRREPDAADHAGTAEAEPGSEQGAASDGVGAAHEQSESTGRGTGAERTDLQLSFFDAHIPTEAKQIESIDQAESEKSPSAFVLSQAEIENALRRGSNVEGSKLRIWKIYQLQPDRKLRAKALAKEYGIGGHSHDYLDGSRGFVNHDWKGLEFVHYPDHQKITLKWAQVEKYIDLMIQSDRYLTDEEKEQRATRQEASNYNVGDEVVVDLPTRTIEGTIGYVGETDVRIDTSAHGQSWDNEVINKQQFEQGLRQSATAQRVDKMLAQAEAIAKESEVPEYERFSVRKVVDGKMPLFAIWDDLYDDYYETNHAVPQFSNEKQAESYLENLKKEVADREAAEWLKVEHAKFLADKDEPEPSDEELDELPISAVMDGEVQTFPDAAALDEALNAAPAGNFRITDDHLGEGGAKQKYARNIEAIRTLFRLEEEHRGATAEEQQVLSQYVGWGGLADAFDPGKDSWAKEYAELKGLLSEDEYAAARSSTLNAHYTSPTVIRGIYDAVERMGFRSGNMRYLQYSTLQQKQLTHFDAWASTFGETTTAIELAPEGTGYRARTRFAKFFNLPELMNMFKEAADIKTSDQLHLPVPEAKFETVVVKPSEIQQDMVKSLSERAAEVHSGAVDPSVDNMLKITSDGRKTGLDQRLMNPLTPDDPDSKLNACVDNVLRIWNETKEDNLTQLIFCDMSTPKGDGSFNVYDDIRTKLLAAGVPESEVEFIHNADTEGKKADLFSKVRSGKVRVLLGSTAKMGAGTNVQTLLVAVHHLDVGWRPSDMTQRNGRIIRQGNKNKQVYVYNYVTEGTFDAYLWQTLENKQKFISQIMTSKSPMRSCDDVDEQALSYAEVKALCAGDPRIREKMDLDVQVAKLKVLRSDYQNQKYRLEDKLLKHYPEEIQKAKNRIAALKNDAQIADAHPQDKENFCGMTIKGMVFDEKKAAGERLMLACKEMPNADMMLLGTYRGFELNIRFDSFKNEHQIVLRGELSYPVPLGDDPRGNIVRLDNAIDNFADRIADAENALQNLEQQKQAAEVEVAKPFAQEEELQTKSARLAELDALLNMEHQSSRTEPEAEEKPDARPSVLAALEEKADKVEPVRPFKSYLDKDGDAR